MYFRLWDAVGGFLFLFAHMQEKLSRNSSQVDLLQELLNLQKDLVTMLLSMLEGKNKSIQWSLTYILEIQFCLEEKIVKLVYNDYPWDPKIVAIVDRWSYDRGQ